MSTVQSFIDDNAPFDFSIVEEESPFQEAFYKPELVAMNEAAKQRDNPRHEFSSLQEEESHRQRELSEEAAEQYKLANQDELSNEEGRVVNLMGITEFLKRLQGIVRAGYHDCGDPQRLGLWVGMRGHEREVFDEGAPIGFKYICAIQTPYMCEWSVVRLDDHGVATKEKYRGWRTVLVELIRAKAITEAEAHKTFGEPTSGAVSRIYRQNLWNLRNRGQL